MVMALRREEKGFDIALEPLEQIVETGFNRPILQLSLVIQNISRAC